MLIAICNEEHLDDTLPWLLEIGKHFSMMSAYCEQAFGLLSTFSPRLLAIGMAGVQSP